VSVVEVIPLSSYRMPVKQLMASPPSKPSLFCCSTAETEEPPPQKPEIHCTPIIDPPSAWQKPPSSRKMSISSLTGSISQALRNLHSPRGSILGLNQKKRKKKILYNSVSKVDKASRLVFPLLFAAINVFYWYSYLSRSQRIHRG